MINLLISNRKRMLIMSLGIVYLWFGMLKFFPGISPAEGLAKQTLTMLTFGLVSANITYFILALWEVTIGIFLLLNLRIKVVMYLALLHILFTFTPLFLLPAMSFNDGIYSLTLVGQYIIKNLIIFSALLFVYPEKEQIAVV
ncbi:MAG: doxx family protein [Saprospiraceae bacterium]